MNREFKFKIMNMSHFDKLFGWGHKPVFLEECEARKNKNKIWKKIDKKISI